MGGRRQQVRLRRRDRHAPVVRRHAAPVGVQARLAPRAVADRPRHGLRRCRRRGALPHHRRRADVARTAGPAHARHGVVVGAGRRWLVPAHDRAGSHQCGPDLRGDLGGRRVPHRRRRRPRWRPINRGLRSEGIPNPTAEVGHCVHRIARHPSRPNVLFMQKHWDVMRSDDSGDSWREVSGNLPTDFGFVIDVHAHEPETVYVVPIKSDSEHYPPDGKLRVYRSRTGGQDWEALTNGLPQQRLLRQRAARRDVGGHARPVRGVLRHHRWAGVRVGRRAATTGRPSSATCRPSCRSRCRPCCG